MKFRKNLEVDFCVRIENFHATHKYHLASTVTIINEPHDGYLGTAVAIESNGSIHLITYGANLTKNSICKSELKTGNKFMCVGELILGKKKEPRFEIIIDDAFQIQWDEN